MQTLSVVTYSTLQQYTFRRLLRCVCSLRCSALALCLSLGRIVDAKYMDTSLYRMLVLIFYVRVLTKLSGL